MKTTIFFLYVALCLFAAGNAAYNFTIENYAASLWAMISAFWTIIAYHNQTDEMK